MAWMKTTIAIPRNLKPKDREVLGEAVVDYIRMRTLDGLDKNNRKFAKYSQKYAEAKGVSRDSVDLFLSGDMLEALKVLSHKSGEITVGFARGDELNGRAEGNIKGTYGQQEKVAPARDFLGIAKKDVAGLVGAMNDDVQVELSDEDIDGIARRAAREILGIEFD
jgi:hypothetical protein